MPSYGRFSKSTTIDDPRGFSQKVRLGDIRWALTFLPVDLWPVPLIDELALRANVEGQWCHGFGGFLESKVGGGQAKVSLYQSFSLNNVMLAPG